jgi:hypothetical protein
MEVTAVFSFRLFQYILTPAKMKGTTRAQYGMEDQALHSRRRTGAAFVAACLCLVAAACVLTAASSQDQSVLSQTDSVKSHNSPATLSDFTSKSSEHQRALASAAVASEKLNVLQKIAVSVKAKVAELKAQSGALNMKPVRLGDLTANRAHSMAEEAKQRYLALHEAATSSSAKAATSSAASSRASLNPAVAKHVGHSDLIDLATQASEAAANAVDSVDVQRLVVAREASTYIKAEKRALVVQHKAALAEASADIARALVADDTAKRAQKQAAMLRKLAQRARSKAALYAAQIKTYDNDYVNTKP